MFLHLTARVAPYSRRKYFPAANRRYAASKYLCVGRKGEVLITSHYLSFSDYAHLGGRPHQRLYIDRNAYMQSIFFPHVLYRDPVIRMQ